MNAPTLFPVDEFDHIQATSREAAAHDRTLDRERVRMVLLAHPEGLTDHEIAERLNEPERKPSFGKRRQELGAVKVRDANGDPVRRRTPLGCSAFVWRLP